MFDMTKNYGDQLGGLFNPARSCKIDFTTTPHSVFTKKGIEHLLNLPSTFMSVGVPLEKAILILLSYSL